MTDSQAINSSVLAEYLDVLKQMQASLDVHDYKHHTQGYLIRAMEMQLSSLIPNCDALRALVAEQEQAEGEPAPQFAVGDTVSGSYENTERLLTISEWRDGYWKMADGSWWKESGLTLISKAVKP